MTFNILICRTITTKKITKQNQNNVKERHD